MVNQFAMDPSLGITWAVTLSWESAAAAGMPVVQILHVSLFSTCVHDLQVLRMVRIWAQLRARLPFLEGPLSIHLSIFIHLYIYMLFGYKFPWGMRLCCAQARPLYLQLPAEEFLPLVSCSKRATPTRPKQAPILP